MAPKKSATSSSKAKRARVDDSTPDPSNSSIPLYPKRLSTSARKWISDREHLELIIEKSFDAPVIEHLGLNTLFGGLGWELSYISPEPIISSLSMTSMPHVSQNRVRVVLNRECLSSILGIPGAVNTITVDSNKEIVDEDLDWNYEVTCNRLEIWPRSCDRRHKLQKKSPFSVSSLIIHTVPTLVVNYLHTCISLSLIHHPQTIEFTIFNNCGYSWDEDNKVWIPLAEKDRLRERNYACFCSIKKTTRTGI
ncbi:hypothetical protein M9H77_07706 [Catharanthus roseus]|uniref:Uncharacterized protein n=1 Tax=Catharanthus roseus TaxID=4058 RepID=A0ACC0BVR0_CATRO|nr:hypothetical protein M9H77_07706 [Catharanthus roseus]